MSLIPFGSPPTPNASTSTKGKIKLAQDLAGTADLPTVVSLSLTADTAVNHKLTSVTDPTNPQDVATKAYVDSLVTGLEAENPVGYASTSALPANTYNNGSSGVGATLTATTNGFLIVDGVTTSLSYVGQRVLVGGESTQSNNGIYTITDAGSLISKYVLTRSTDYDQSAEVNSGDLFAVAAPVGLSLGSNNGKVFIALAPTPFIFGSSSLNFSSIGSTYSAGTGLGLSGTTFNVQTDGTSVDINGSNQIERMALTGDVTASAGSAATTLASIITGSSVGDATHIPVLTYDNKGRITAVSTATPSATAPTQRTFAYFVS